MINIEKSESIGYLSSIEKGYDVLEGTYVPIEQKYKKEIKK